MPQVVFVGAGHLHKPAFVPAKDTFIFQGGSDYAFTEVEFNGIGVLRHQHWSLKDQEAFSGIKLVAPDQAIANKAERLIKEVEKANSVVIRGPLSHRNLPGMDASQARKLIVGFHLGHSLEVWAKESLPEEHAPHRAPIALYNQLSYSWEERIDRLFEKPITLGMLKDAIAFPGVVRLLLLPGAELEQLYRGMREYGKKSKVPFRTPIIAGPYKESTQGLLELIEGRWHRLSPRILYPVVLDHWTGLNGYQIPEVECALSKAAWEKLPRQQNLDVIPRYFHSGLSGAVCRRELIRQGRVERYH